jgi:hypothetical protein
MVDTPVLEAGAERRESSSLSWGTINIPKNICTYSVLIPFNPIKLSPFFKLAAKSA